MWCEASLTGFSHMMFYEQAANDKYCPVRFGANVLLILGHFQKCLTTFLLFFLYFSMLSNVFFTFYNDYLAQLINII